MRFLFASNQFRGFAHVLSSAGHEVGFWDRNIPAFDMFAANRFDALFVDGATVDRALAKCLRKAKGVIPIIWNLNGLSPEAVGLKLKTYFSKADLPDHTHLPPAADLFMYRQGVKKPEFECDVAFIGDCDSPNTDEIQDLCQSRFGFNVKIFGSGWSLPQCVGRIRENEAADVYVSARVSIDLHNGSDDDRSHNIGAAGGCVASACPEEIRRLLADDNARNERIATWRSSIVDNTYFERTIDMFVALDLEKHIPRVLQAKGDLMAKRLRP